MCVSAGAFIFILRAELGRVCVSGTKCFCVRECGIFMYRLNVSFHLISISFFSFSFFFYYIFPYPGYVAYSASVSHTKMLWVVYTDSNSYPVAVGGASTVLFFRQAGKNKWDRG